MYIQMDNTGGGEKRVKSEFFTLFSHYEKAIQLRENVKAAEKWTRLPLSCHERSIQLFPECI